MKNLNAIVWVLICSAIFIVSVSLWYETGNLRDEIELGLATIQNLETGSNLDSAEMEAVAGRVEASEQRAIGYLGIFEAIAFWVSVSSIVIVVLGVLAAVIGVSNFNEMRKQLDDTRLQLANKQDELSTSVGKGLAVLGLYEEQNKSQLEEFHNARNKIAELELGFQQEISQKLASFSETYQKNRFAFTLLSLAERDLRMYNYTSAIHTIERALELDPNNALAHYYLGIILTLSQEMDGSRTHLEQALQLDPEFLHAKAALGFTVRRIGETASDNKERQVHFVEAEKLILGALLSDEHLLDFDGESWFGSLAGLYRRQGKRVEAEVYYDRAAKITPLSSYPISNLARLALQQASPRVNKLYAKVKRLAKREISLDLGNYWAYGDLLAAHLVLGENTEALETLENLLDAIPEWVTDVLPRIIETVEDINTAPSYEEDKRHKVTVEKVLQRLKDEDKKERNLEA